MNNTPERLKKKWRENPAKRCLRWKEGNCKGRLTKEHALTYAGRQIQEDFAILDLCEYHHLGDGLDKLWNIRYAMSRATEADKLKFPRIKWSK